MKAEDVKMNDTVYLKDHIVLHEDKGIVTRLAQGTPLRVKQKTFDANRKVVNIEFHVIGSFVSIEIQGEDMNAYIADYAENINNLNAE